MGATRNICDAITEDPSKNEALIMINKVSPANFCKSDDSDRCPFVLAARLGRLDLCKAMWERDKKRKFCRKVIDEALLNQCQYDETSHVFIKQLIEWNCRPDCSDICKDTPLHYLAVKPGDGRNVGPLTDAQKGLWRQRRLCLDTLIRQAPPGSPLIDMKNGDGLTPLVRACQTCTYCKPCCRQRPPHTPPVPIPSR